MNRRSFLKQCGLIVGLSAVSSFTNSLAVVTARTDKMNVLFIDIEDMTAESVGCYGNPVVKTPNMDAFAKQGVRFSRCYCQAPMCNPSRTSFLTGLRPDTTNVYTNEDPMNQCLPASVITLPEMLEKKGIYSINIGKLFHHTWTSEKQIGSFDRLEFCERPKGYKGISKGYPKHLQEEVNKLPRPKFRYSADPQEEQKLKELKTQRDEIWKTAEHGSREYNKARAMFQQPQANIVGDSGLLEEQDHDGKKARMAAHILGQLAKDKQQFFMCLGFSKPHTPLRCPKKYLDMYNLDDIPSPPAPTRDDKNIPDVAKRFGRNFDIFNSYYEHPVSDIAARKAVQAYYGCVSMIDAQIGLVLKALEETGLKDNTMVIIFSDHGFQLGEHNLWSKYTLFEQSTRIPFLMCVPGRFKPGIVCDEIIELVDLVPTLGEALKLPIPDKLEGTSFMPLLEKPDQNWKKAAFCILPMGEYIGRSIRTKDWQYNEWTSRKNGSMIRELYHIAEDKWQQINLAGDKAYSKQVDRLSNMLKVGWKKALPDVS